jgi:malate dehydrogenase (oxaloacetate-decarboxylating)
MGYKQRIIRTLRCKNKNTIGVLAKLISTISSHGGGIGEIHTIAQGDLYNMRDIAVIANDENELKEIIAAVQKLDVVTLMEVIDEVLKYHEKGKLKVDPRYPVHSIDDLRRVYTPGVAEVSLLICKDEEKAKVYTGIGHTVALVTNGTRVLGLGPIGPVAAMPVMEGKAALFSQFTGMSMIPILCDTEDPQEIIRTVKTIAKGFAAIQLEDIRTPDCYTVEAELDAALPIPVMHDDQHGTAVVALAAAMNACKLAGTNIKKTRVGMIGLGGAGSAISRLIMAYTKNKVMGTDVSDFACKRLRDMGGLPAPVEEVMAQSTLIIATTGKKGIIRSKMIRKGQIILALSNPEPEISINTALRAGAAFASDGSRVNNLLGFPGILKGAIDSRTAQITQGMYIAAAKAIAEQATDKDLIPDPINPKVHRSVARAVAKAAMEAGVAGVELDADYFHD